MGAAWVLTELRCFLRNSSYGLTGNERLWRGAGQFQLVEAVRATHYVTCSAVPSEPIGF